MRRAEALRGAVLESALDCVITMNHEGRIVEFNPAAERTFGYRRAEVVGKTVGRHAAFPRACATTTVPGSRATSTTGESRILGRRLELTGRRSDGTRVPGRGVDRSHRHGGAADIRRLPARRHGAQARRGEHPPPGRDRRALERRGRRGRRRRADRRVEPGRRAPLRVVGGRGDRHADRRHRAPGPRGRGRISGAPADGGPARSPTTGPCASARTASWSTSRSRCRRSATRPASVVGMAGIIRDISEELEIERERVRLLEQETKARRRAEDLERRASFLVEIHTALDSSLDYEVVLRRLARITVPRLADWCVIHMQGDDGALRRLAVAHSDPKQERFAWDLEDRYPTDPNDTQGVPEVLRTGKPELYPRDHRRDDPGERARSRAPRDHPRARPALGDARPAPRARADARGRDAGVGRVGAPLRPGRPRLRVRDGAPCSAVDRQRAPAQRADRAQPGERVPRGRRAPSSTRRSTWRRPSSGSRTSRCPRSVTAAWSTCSRRAASSSASRARRPTRRRRPCSSASRSSASTSTARIRSRSRCGPGACSESTTSTAACTRRGPRTTPTWTRCTAGPAAPRWSRRWSRAGGPWARSRCPPSRSARSTTTTCA